jgi:hypothetical protein
MNNTYTDLVHQTFNFPQEDFKVKERISAIQRTLI